MAAEKLNRDELIVQYYGMVQRIANRMAARYPTSVDVGDLIGIGTLGLIDAAERYDPEMNTSFSSYALIRIKGAIVDGLRKQDWVPRSVRNRSREMEHATQEAVRKEGSDGIEAVARALGIDVATARNWRERSEVLTQISMWERKSGGEQTIADTLQGEDRSPEEDLEREDIALWVRDALATLPERDQIITRLHYYENKTFKEIGTILGVTESRISQLHSRLKRRLVESLNAAQESSES